MKKFTIKGFWKILKESFNDFIDDKVLKLSASLAYYTVFSLAPLLLLLLYLCGLFFGKEAVEGSIFGQIEGFVGKNSALQVQEMIKSASLDNKGNTAAIIGGIMLIIGATTVFGEIQDSINTIWGIKTKPGKGLMLFIKTRLLSFGVIASLGFLLLVSLGLSALLEALSGKLAEIFPDVTVVLFYILNIIISFAVISTLFGVIFKILPDAEIQWKDVVAGSIATAVLFMFGKFGISFYIAKSDVGNTYGAAGSLVILLVWIYYSSVILFFGAEFTKRYAISFGSAIHPNKYAVFSRTVEIEEGSKTVQAVDKKEKLEDKKQEEQEKKE